MRPSPARREVPSLFGEAHHLFGEVHSPVRRSTPSVRRERLSRTQCRNGCEIKKKCELVAAKRIENLIYTREVLLCNAPASNSSAIAPPASNSSAIASPANSSFPMALSHGAPASSVLPATSQLPRRPDQHLPDGAPLRRPCQQQTSAGGEEYSGLASNLAHLGRIC